MPWIQPVSGLCRENMCLPSANSVDFRAHGSAEEETVCLLNGDLAESQGEGYITRKKQFIIDKRKPWDLFYFPLPFRTFLSH